MPIELGNFQEGTEPVAGERSTMDYKGKVTAHMIANPDQAYTQKEIAEALDFEARQIRGALVALEKAGKLERKSCDVDDGKGGSRKIQHWHWVEDQEA